MDKGRYNSVLVVVLLLQFVDYLIGSLVRFFWMKIEPAVLTPVTLHVRSIAIL